MKSRIPLFAAVAAGALLLLAAGCDSLPAGDPPEGDLTSNEPPPVTSALALRNHLATQLIVYALRSGVASLDPGNDPETVAIAVEAARTVGFRLERNAPLRLDLRRDGSGADLVAVQRDSGVEVWRSQRP